MTHSQDIPELKAESPFLTDRVMQGWGIKEQASPTFLVYEDYDVEAVSIGAPKDLNRSIMEKTGANQQPEFASLLCRVTAA